MSTLLFDLGNTRWKMASATAGSMGDVISGDYRDQRRLRAGVLDSSASIKLVLIASVADRATTDGLIDVVRQSLPAVPVVELSSTDPVPGLVNGYRKPEQLGVDRLLAMVAVRAQTQAPFCVVDAGTAVTIDFVASDGHHLGGCILPGLAMMRECLLANTSIPHDAEVESDVSFGRDTATAVALGGRYAVVGAVERLVAGEGALFLTSEPAVFIGGGDAEQFVGLFARPCTKLNDLVLRGLAVVAVGRET